MTRTIQDNDLLLWEAYANSGEFGSAEQAKIIFQCLTDPSRRARMLPRHAPRAAVEQEIATLPDPDLLDLLAGAEELR
jgi:hypothetical protein